MTFSIGTDRAMSFGTGSSAEGYTLSSVELDMTVTNPGGTYPTYTVKLYSDSSSDPSNPDTELATLTNPSSLSTGLNSFTADPAIDLAHNTSYWIVFSVSDATGADIGASLNMTRADDETAEPGWKISNTYRYKEPTDTTWTNDQNRTPKFQVKGDHNDMTPPRVLSAAVEFNTLTITFNEPLHEDSVPSTDSFSVTGSDGTTISVSGVDVSGSTVTLTLASLVTHGMTVTVSYTPPDSNPLQDHSPGNDVAQFENRRVTVNTPRGIEPGVIYEVAAAPDGRQRVEHRVVRAENGDCYTEYYNGNYWAQVENYGPTAEGCRKAAWNAYLRSLGEDPLPRDSDEFPAGHPPALDDFTCPSGWQASTGYGQQWCSIRVADDESLALSPERAREFLRLGLRPSDALSTNPSRSLDYHNFVSNNCGEGQVIGYTNGGNGSPVCHPKDEMVSCSSGNEAGLTGRRCVPDHANISYGNRATDRRFPASGVAIPLEVKRVWDPIQWDWVIERDENGNIVTQEREDPQRPCESLYWDENLSQWVCARDGDYPPSTPTTPPSTGTPGQPRAEPGAPSEHIIIHQGKLPADEPPNIIRITPRDPAWPPCTPEQRKQREEGEFVRCV